MNIRQRIISAVLAAFLLLGCACASGEAFEWTCSVCGAENTSAFCPDCGAKKPETVSCPGCGKQYLMESAPKFCVDCGTRLEEEKDGFRMEGPGFDSPQEAVLNYLEGLKETNLRKMLQSFCFETRARRTDVAANIRRISSYNCSSMAPALPNSNDDFVNAVNTMDLCSVCLRQIKLSLINYLTPADFDPFEIIAIGRNESEDKVLSQFDMDKIKTLKTLKDIKIYSSEEAVKAGILPESILYEQNLRSMEKLRAVYGADEYLQYYTEFDVGGKKGTFSASVARYGSKWYLCECGGYIAQVLGVDYSRMAFAIEP